MTSSGVTGGANEARNSPLQSARRREEHCPPGPHISLSTSSGGVSCGAVERAGLIRPLGLLGQKFCFHFLFEAEMLQYGGIECVEVGDDGISGRMELININDLNSFQGL